MKKIWLYYHGVDADGWASAFLIKYAIENNIINLFPKNKMIALMGWNYGYHVKYDYIRKEDTIILADISFSKEDMERVQQIVGEDNFYWIDHHKSIIETMSHIKIKGNQNNNIAACELAFEWIVKNRTDEWKDKGHEHILRNLLMFIRYIADYDIHNKNSKLGWENVETFFYGLKSFALDPNTEGGIEFWKEVISCCENSEIKDFIDDILDIGKHIQISFESHNFQICKAYSFEATVKHFEKFGSGLFVNMGLAGSLAFKSHYNPEIHNFVCSFQYNGKDGTWRASIFSEKEEIDLTELTSMFNGGGHKGAGGFKISSFSHDSSKKIITFIPIP